MRCIVLTPHHDKLVAYLMNPRQDYRYNLLQQSAIINNNAPKMYELLWCQTKTIIICLVG